jgi:chaperonin GroES
MRALAVSTTHPNNRAQMTQSPLPKLLKSSQNHEFILAEYSGKNESGYMPLGDMVLIAFDKAADTTSGGISLPENIVERMDLASESGVIVALGSEAFRWIADRTREWQGYKPQPGDRVYMERYSGQLIKGVDGKTYRLATDKCVGAVKIDPDAEAGKMVARAKIAALVGNLKANNV